MSLDIAEVNSGKLLKKFLRLPHTLYKNDPCFIPPLDFEKKGLLNRKKNPFFKQSVAALFLALDGDKPVGRISAQIHHQHLEKYKDSTGFFGFFESVDDPAVAKALIDHAGGWLKQKGMKKIRGPFNLAMYDNETGILIDGFDTPPSIMMGHNPPYYPALLEKNGFKKFTDLYAWTHVVSKMSEPAQQLADFTRQHPGLTLRPFNMKNFKEEVRLMMQIYNEAWSANLGFVPTDEEEIGYIAQMLKPIIDPDMTLFAFVNGDPAAFSVCLPNINEAIFDLKGRLFPFGWAKLLWRLKRGLKSLRLCLMGVRPAYRGRKFGGSLSVLLNVEMQLRGIANGYKTGELSWTLENNDRINKGIEFMGSKKYKTYRIFEKDL